MEDDSSSAQMDERFSTLLSHFAQEEDKESRDKIKPTKRKQISVKNWLSLFWTCFYCEKTYNCYLFFKSHIQSAHDIENVEDAYYQCNDCDEPPFGYSTYLNHVRGIHHKRLRLCCDVCNKIFPDYGELSVHRSKHIETLNTSFPTVYNCTLCEKCCPTEKQLKNHIQHFHNPLYSMDTDDHNLQYSVNEENTRASRFSDVIEEDSSSQYKGTDQDIDEILHCGNFEKSFPSENDLQIHSYSSTAHEKVKQKRCTNFTSKESFNLLRIISKYKKTIENKRIDAGSKYLKQEAWEIITEEFNKNNEHPRDVKALKIRFKNMKKLTYNKFSKQNRQLSINSTIEESEITSKNDGDETASPLISHRAISFESLIECDSSSADLTIADKEPDNIPSPIAVPTDVPITTSTSSITANKLDSFAQPKSSLYSPKQKIYRKRSCTSKKWHELAEEKINFIRERTLQQREQHEHTLKYIKEEHELKMQLMKEELELTKTKLQLEIDILKNKA